MPTSAATSPAIPLVLAQQDAHNQAYENGQKVGQIFGFIMGIVIVFWVVGKVFRRR